LSSLPATCGAFRAGVQMTCMVKQTPQISFDEMAENLKTCIPTSLDIQKFCHVIPSTPLQEYKKNK
jgi:hypothetical protein